MRYLAFGDPECYFIVEARDRTDNCHFGIGVKGMEDATGSYLRSVYKRLKSIPYIYIYIAAIAS